MPRIGYRPQRPHPEAQPGPASTTRNGPPSWPATPPSTGSFVTAVETTGIYCRPSCPAKRPNRANVRFYATAEEAERAGFRPCKRCKPGAPSLAEQHADKVRAACRLIETPDQTPKLDDLADAVGLSPYHFHRIFKAALGVTPKAYATAHRHQRVREELGKSATVTAGDLRRGLQLQRPLLRDLIGGARHDPKPIPRRRRQRGDQVRDRRKLARPGAGRGERQGRMRHFLRRRS